MRGRNLVQEREQKRLREIHQRKIKQAKSSVDTGTPARRRKAKQGGSGKKAKKKIQNQLDSSIADLDRLLKEQECWGPNFGRLSTIMEMSQDFEGTRINILEECRTRCKKVKSLLDASGGGGAAGGGDGETKAEEQAFTAAQEEAQIVKAMLDEIASSVKLGDEGEEGEAVTKEQEQAEQMTTDTLKSLQDAIDALVLDDADADADGDGGADGGNEDEGGDGGSRDGFDE